MANEAPRVAVAVHGRFHAFDLARELQRRGHLVQLATTYPRFVARRYVLPPVPIRSAPVLELWRRLHGRLPLVADPDPGLAQAFARFAARTLPGAADILVGWSAGVLEAISVARERGMKIVVERGSTHIDQQTQTLAEEYGRFGLVWTATSPQTIERERAEYEAADAIVTPSGYAKATFAAQGVPPDKVHVNPLGVDLAAFGVPDRPARERPTILFVGRVGLRKGVPWLLRGFAPLATRAWLRLVGPVEAGVERILADEPTTGVDVIGPVRGQELRRAFADADIFCLPSIEEGFAQAILEAMAAGLPVVATEATGCGEAVDDGIEGLIVAARDTAAITKALATLVDDAERRRAMGASARSRVAREFGWEHYGERALEIYRRIMETT